MDPSVEELARRAIGGDREALSALLDRFEPTLRSELRVPERWRSALSVEDVLQEAYTDAFLHVSRFEYRGEGSFRAWLLSIARNNLLGAVRMLATDKRGGRLRRAEPSATRSSLVGLYEYLGEASGTPSREAAHRDAEAAMRRALERLPETYRQVVRMYDLEERSVGEVARTLGRTPGAVFMLRARAHRKLNDLWGRASDYLSRVSAGDLPDDRGSFTARDCDPGRR